MNKEDYKFLFTCAFEEGYINKIKRGEAGPCHEKYDFTGRFQGGDNDCGVQLRAEDLLITAETILSMVVPLSGVQDNHLPDQIYCEGNLPVDPKYNEDFGYPTWAVTGARMGGVLKSLVGDGACYSSVIRRINNYTHIADWFCHDDMGWSERSCELKLAAVDAARLWLLILGLGGLVRPTNEFPASGMMRPLLPPDGMNGGFLTSDYGIVGLRSKTPIPAISISQKKMFSDATQDVERAFLLGVEQNSLIPGNRIITDAKLSNLAARTGLLDFCSSDPCPKTPISTDSLAVMREMMSLVQGKFYGYFDVSQGRSVDSLNTAVTGQSVILTLNDDIECVVLNGPTASKRPHTVDDPDDHGKPLRRTITREVPDVPTENPVNVGPGETAYSVIFGAGLSRYVRAARHSSIIYTYEPSYDADGRLQSVKLTSVSVSPAKLAYSGEYTIKSGTATMRTPPKLSKCVTIEEMALVLLIEVVKNGDVRYSIDGPEVYPDYESIPGYPREDTSDQYKRYALVKIPATDVHRRSDGGFDGTIDLTELQPEKMVRKIDPGLNLDTMLIDYGVLEFCAEIGYSVRFPDESSN